MPRKDSAGNYISPYRQKLMDDVLGKNPHKDSNVRKSTKKLADISREIHRRKMQKEMDKARTR